MLIIGIQELPLHIAAVFIGFSWSGMLIIVLVSAKTASTHKNSLTFIRTWRNHIKANNSHEQRAQLAFLRSCRPLRFKIGQFINITSSTSYKMVLLICLHSMKAVLMVGKYGK